MAQVQRKFAVASNGKKKSAQSSRPNAAPKKGSHSHMAKAGKPKTKNKAAKKKAANPFSSHRKKSRNPTGIGALIQPKNIFEMGIAGLASAIATRQLPQLIMGTSNTGWAGYAANAGAAIAATAAAGLLAGPAAGTAAFVGGLVILLDRVLTEQVSPIGQYLALSGVGDATAMTKLGTVRDGWYTHPGLVDGQNNLIVPDPYTNAAVAAVVARYPGISQPQAVAMVQQTRAMGAVNPDALRRHTASGQVMSSRFAGRFNQY